ncbi:MAG: hypothetical protein ACRCZF_09440 [Gemmataceae bacterium]
MPRMVLLILGLAVLGCEKSRKPTFAEPVEAAKNEPLANTLMPKPRETDLDAESILDAAVRAHTGGKPELLEKLRGHNVERTGKMFDVKREQMIEASMIGDAVWADKYRVVFRGVKNETTLTMCLMGNDGWQVFPGQNDEKALPMPPGMPAIMAADVYAEWMLVLAPLRLGSSHIAKREPTEEKVDGKSTDGVWVWMENRVPILVLIDRETKRVVRVKYTVEEFGGPVPKSLSVYEHITEGGIRIPYRIDYAANSKPFAQWTKSRVTFPKSIPDSYFQKP